MVSSYLIHRPTSTAAPFLSPISPNYDNRRSSLLQFCLPPLLIASTYLPPSLARRARRTIAHPTTTILPSSPRAGCANTPPPYALYASLTLPHRLCCSAPSHRAPILPSAKAPRPVLLKAQVLPLSPTPAAGEPLHASFVPVVGTMRARSSAPQWSVATGFGFGSAVTMDAPTSSGASRAHGCELTPPARWVTSILQRARWYPDASTLDSFNKRSIWRGVGWRCLDASYNLGANKADREPRECDLLLLA
jgi:hypothetical protein